MTFLTKDENKLEDRITYILSEWFNDSAPLGQESYRLPAKRVIEEVQNYLKKSNKKKKGKK